MQTMKTQRYRLCEAPSSLLEKLSGSNEEVNEIVETPIIITPPLTPSSQVSVKSPDESGTSLRNVPLRHHGRRKNPYPIRSPDRNSDGITLKLDVFTAFMQNPNLLLASEKSKLTGAKTNVSTSSSLWTSDSDSPNSPNPECHSTSPYHNGLSRAKRQRKNPTQRTRRSKALGRVIGGNNVGDSTAIRTPPPLPSQEWRALKERLENLELDATVLEREVPEVTWKGPSMEISKLPHYNFLHATEAKLASTLRLTPAQYLTSKSSIISAARRYEKRTMPFRKSDAQRLLRIDVNKSSKLWEFFRGIAWI